MNYTNIVYAADTLRVQAGGKSIFETAPAAVAGVLTSAYAGIYNTATWYASKLTNSEHEPMDVAKTLDKLNGSWGDFYRENSQVIDTVGFIGGAFIPGGAALKGLKLLRAGAAPKALQPILGFTATKQQFYLEKGLSQIATEGSAVFSTFNKNKALSMSWGMADNLLQSLVFETAALASMHQSTLFAEESKKDMFLDLTFAALTGGAMGGAVGAIFTNSLFKQAGKKADALLRDVDVVNVRDALKLNFGDKAFSIIDDMLTLGKGLQDKEITFSLGQFGEKSFNFAAKDKALADTYRTASQRLEKSIREVSTDETVGAGLADYVKTYLAKAAEKQAPPEQIRKDMGAILFGLSKVRGLSPTLKEMDSEIMYFGHSTESLLDAGSFVRRSEADTPYRVVGGWDQMKSGVLGVDAANVREAWDAGFDFLVNPKTKKIHINPESTKLIRAGEEEDLFYRVIFDPRTGRQSDRVTAPTIADMAFGTAAGKLVATPTGVTAGGKTYAFKFGVYNESTNSIDQTARYVWSANLKQAPSSLLIDARDFALMDNDRLLRKMGDNTIRVRKLDGTVVAAENLHAVRSLAFETKIALLKDEKFIAKYLDNNGALELDRLAIALNVEREWLEKAIEEGFQGSRLFDLAKHRRDLTTYNSRENLVLLYEKAALDNSLDYPDMLTAFYARQYHAAEDARMAAATVLGEDYARLPDSVSSLRTGIADATGAGPGAFTFSNAEYTDKLRAWAQSSGAAAHLIGQERVKKAIEYVQPAFQKILANNNVEFAAVYQAYLRHNGHLFLDVENSRLVDLASYRKSIGKKDATFETIIKIEKPETLDAFKKFSEDHRRWFEQNKALAVARGEHPSWDPDAFYLPPVDTRATPYFAFVRHVPDKINTSNSEVTMIFARTEAELQRLATEIRSEFGDQVQVLFKNDTKDYYQAKRAYEYSSGLHSPQIDSFLRRQGKASSELPTMDPKSVVDTFVSYIQRREQSLVRKAIRTNYADTFAELDWLSDQYTKAAKSKFSFLGKTGEARIQDPFGDYERLALNISKRDEYELWRVVNDSVDYVGKGAYRAAESAYKSAAEGKISWEDANKALQKVGISGPFSSQQQFLEAQIGSGQGNLAKTLVAKGNTFLTNVGLRLDTMQAVINAISTPILQGAELSAISRMISKDPELSRIFAEATSVTHPDGYKVPSQFKLIAQAIKNYFGPAGKERLEHYKKLGAVREPLLQHHASIEDIAMLPKIDVSKYTAAMDRAIETGAKLTGNNFVEEFIRFMSADIMKQLTDPVVAAGKMSVREQNSWMQIFTNRVHGNYIASQRPIAFQGTVGAALSLFQTYQFNLLQQLYRHIENKDLRTIAILGSLQSGLYGFNGLPFFDAINTHLIGNANMNEGHHDAYSAVSKLVGKEVGDFLLYGAASALPIFSEKSPALFTRGDLNPRHLTILPNPMNPSEIPIFAIGGRVWDVVKNLGSQLTGGADAGAAMLHAMEHQGLSRPLAGLAVALRGSSTTSKGSLISANQDFFSLQTASRLAGARPMDEAVALNHYFRLNAYKAKDRERVEKLGTIIKQKMRAGTFTEDDALEFMSKYAAAGGRIENYSQAIQRWFKAAHQSDINRLMQAHRSSYGQRLLEVMGADPLEDLSPLAPEQ
jgi:hypothetical protein